MATMKPPNVTPPPAADQTQNSSQQPQQQQQSGTTITPITMGITTTPVTIPVSSQQIMNKSHTIVATTAQVQQAPLALTTQPQNQTRPQLLTTPQHLITQSIPTTTTPTITQPVPQILHQTKIQANQLPQTTTITPQTVQPIALATAPTSTGPTALVIIPQHSTNTSANPTKLATKVTPYTATVNVTTAHVTLSATTQSTPIQLQAPITTHLSNITAPIPLTAHQQSTTIPTLATRPPTTLPVVPITATTANIKSEANKYVCCLLDNGIRCDRVAGNASFSARIQKIVGTKKMNFALDPTVRHAYICEHHKAIITVAKKSTPLARDTKSNARNYTANNNNNANTPANQQIGNFNDLTRQQTIQHPVNIELLTNQNRLANNHAGTINNLPVRAGTQIAYTHYPGPHPNQVTPMDVMMSSSFDNAPPSVIAESTPSSSGGVDVDLQQLQVNTLRRYKRHFRVQTRPGLNKMQLAESLKGHFRTLPIIEKEAITYFVYIVKCYRNKLDHNPKAD